MDEDTKIETPVAEGEPEVIEEQKEITQPEETPVAESTEEVVPQDEPAVEKEIPAEDTPADETGEAPDEEAAMFEKMMTALTKLVDAVDALTKKVDDLLANKALETTEEVQPLLEQSDREADAEEKTVDSPTRKSEQPALEEVTTEEKSATPKYAGLQDALWKHFASKTR